MCVTSVGGMVTTQGPCGRSANGDGYASVGKMNFGRDCECAYE